jgi:hypothetical protein
MSTPYKRIAKKVFSADASSFPTLNETIKSSSTAKFNFSAAAKKINNPVLELEREVPPGWVHIRRHQGKIEYKYGLPVKKISEDEAYYAEEMADRRFNNCMLKYRLAREQYDIDRDIERLGDLSIHYSNNQTLTEKYEEIEREMNNHNLSSSEEDE